MALSKLLITLIFIQHVTGIEEGSTIGVDANYTLDLSNSGSGQTIEDVFPANPTSSNSNCDAYANYSGCSFQLELNCHSY